MADITWNDVIVLAPDQSTVGSSAQTEILAFVNGALDVSFLGGESSQRTRMARVYLAAHFGAMTLAGSNGSSGPVVSESAGGLSRAYAFVNLTGSEGLDALNATSYGRMYKRLIRGSSARGPHVI